MSDIGDFIAETLVPVFLIGLMVFVLVFVVASFFSEGGDMKAFSRDCVNKGGHLYAPDIVLCVSDDGRIVEAMP